MGLEIVYYLVIGIVAGVLAGMLGIGGGLVIVPALAWYFAGSLGPNAMHFAAGTSLAIMIWTTSSSAWRHHRHRAIRFDIWRRWLPGILTGTILGAALADFLKSRTIEIMFACFLVFVGIRMLMLLQTKPGRQLPARMGLNLVGFFIGLKSGLLGIGGGTLTIPFLTRCNISMREAIATSTLCSMTVGIAGSLCFALFGLNDTGHIPQAVGYIYLPAFAGVTLASIFTAPFGVALAHRLPVTLLKRLFGFFLLLVAIKLFTSL